VVQSTKEDCDRWLDRKRRRQTEEQICRRVPRGRVSHVDDLLADPASALFAGLSVLPKRSALTGYSYRLGHDHQQRFLAAVDLRMIGAGLATAEDDFRPDYQAVMHSGADPVLEKHYVPTRFQRSRSVLTFFAQDTGTHFTCCSCRGPPAQPTAGRDQPCHRTQHQHERRRHREVADRVTIRSVVDGTRNSLVASEGSRPGIFTGLKEPGAAGGWPGRHRAVASHRGKSLVDRAGFRDQGL
jgi:hypothetical protein